MDAIPKLRMPANQGDKVNPVFLVCPLAKRTPKSGNDDPKFALPDADENDAASVATARLSPLTHKAREIFDIQRHHNAAFGRREF